MTNREDSSLPDSTAPAPITGLIVRKRLSLAERLRDSKPIVMFMLFFMVLGMIGGLFGGGIFGHVALLHSPLIAFFTMFFVGLCIGVGAVVAASGAGKLLAKKKSKLIELQRKLIEETTDDICRDLEILVKGYLALKRFDVADFYSTLSLQQSVLPAEQRANKLTDWILSVDCWASTPAYHKSPNYYLLWLFESRGIFTLTAREMRFGSKRISFGADLADIRDIKLQQHPRWMKPIPLRYIVVTFLDEGIEHTIHLSPSTSQADTIFEVNKQVDEWYHLLLTGRERRIATRTLEKMRAQCPSVPNVSSPTQPSS